MLKVSKGFLSLGLFTLFIVGCEKVVDPGPEIKVQALGDAVVVIEDTPLDATLPIDIANVDISSVTFELVTPPTKGTLQILAGGLVRYAPDANKNGADSFVFKATSGSVSSQNTINISITPVNDSPVTEMGSLAVVEDVGKVGIAVGTDVDTTDTLTFSIVSQGTKGTASINSSSGAFTYTPNLNAVGSDSFVFQVSDGTLSSSNTISVVIAPVNDAPIAAPGSITLAEDTTKPGALSASDIEADTLTYSIVSNPTKGTIQNFLAATGDYIYVANANANGSDSFTFRVNDGNSNSNTATVSVTITPVNDAPTAIAGTLTVVEDINMAGTLSGNDIDGDNLTYAIVTQGTKGTVSVTDATGAFTYRPNSNISGTDTFTFRVNDGTVNSATASISVTITPVNDAPVASSQSATTNEDIAKNITLAATDVDSNTLTYSIVTQPTQGILVLNAGTAQYTPNSNYNGKDSFTFKASDGTLLSNLATVSLTIAAVNDSPVANDKSVTVSRGAEAKIPVSQLGSDVDGDPITLTFTTAPIHGSIQIVQNQFVYTPFNTSPVAENISFHATDSSSAQSGNGMISINFVERTLPNTGEAIASFGERLVNGNKFYRLVNGVWSFHQNLTTNNLASAMEQEWMIAGYNSAYNPNAGGTTGAVYFYKLTNGSWAATQTLFASDAKIDGGFGGRVKIWNDWAMVTGHSVGSGGGIYFLKRSGNIWAERQKLVFDAAPGGGGEKSGLASIAMHDGWAMAGNPTSSVSRGVVYILKLENDAWTVSEIIQPQLDFASFGGNIAMHGSEAIIGANGEQRCYFFRRSGATWTKTKFLECLAGQGGPAMYGDLAAMGSWSNAPSHVNVFRLVGGEWNLREKLFPATGTETMFGITNVLSSGGLFIRANTSVYMLPLTPFKQ